MNTSSGIRNAHRLGRQMLESFKERKPREAYYGSVGNGDSTQGHIYSNTACHAGLKHKGHITFTPSKIVDVLLPTTVTKAEALAWYSFILERSVYSSMFAERRAKTGHERGYFIYHAGVNANIMVAGAVAIRMASEKPYIVKHFYRLVKAGTKEDIAFIAAHTLFNSGNNVGLEDGGQVGHVAIVPSIMNKNCLLRYFKSDIEYFPSYAVKISYNNFNYMFGEGNPVDRITTTLRLRWKAATEKSINPEVKRVALFNLKWNKPKVVNLSRISLPKKQAYPILAKILNEYKQEILHEA